MYQPYNYAKRLERIEELKAKERRLSTLKQNTDTQIFVERSIGETNDIVANKLSIGSGEQYRKEKFIVDNKQSLPPTDFEKWDEGKLSTNKAYNHC